MKTRAAVALEKGKPLTTQTEMTLVNVTVTDPYSRLVTGLEQENFRVRTNLRQQVAQHRRGFAAPHASEHHQAQTFALRRRRQGQCGRRRPERRAVRDDALG